MTTDPVVAFDVDDGVGILRIQRPPVNALSVEVQELLRAHAAQIATREDIASVVIHGGATFAAGADIREMAEMTQAEMIARAPQLQSAFSAVATIPQPVAAAITGYALGGGCELALCADIRIAARDAQLGQPEVKLGIIPGAGGTQRLPRVIGLSRAKDLILTGRMVGAAEALDIGLVDRVVDADDALAEAVRWARQFVHAAPRAVRAAKRAIDEGIDADLDRGLRAEQTEFVALFGTEDHSIGMRAFIDRTAGDPVFTGR